jgi:galactose oxidase
MRRSAVSAVQVVTWSADMYNSQKQGRTGQMCTATLDLVSHAVSQMLVNSTNHDMFCPGIATMGDGTLVVTGGDTRRRAST